MYSMRECGSAECQAGRMLGVQCGPRTLNLSLRHESGSRETWHASPPEAETIISHLKICSSSVPLFEISKPESLVSHAAADRRRYEKPHPAPAARSVK